jgi:SAM-dependent methyltransferase
VGEEAHPQIVGTLASQLGVDPAAFAAYLHGRDTTRREHVLELQRDFGFRSFSARIYREPVGPCVGQSLREVSRLELAALHWTWPSARVTFWTNRDGTFLDVGCANGHLMECAVGWLAESGYRIEPYGLDILPELAALARQRLPRWADRIVVGNAIDWIPERRFDFVRTGHPGRIGHCGHPRARELAIEWLREAPNVVFERAALIHFNSVGLGS